YHTFLRNLFFLSMLGLIILLLTAIANELLIVRGLYTLQNAALQIRDGNLKARVESIRGFIEVKELTRIFNEMADNIEQQAMHRTQIEEELQFRNTILTAQQESSIDGIMVVDEDYNIVLYNHRLMDMWEVPSDLIARKANEPTLFVANKVADSLIFIQRVQYLYQHKEEISQEEILLKDGRVFERYTTPMIGPGDKYYGRIWYFHDITERKHAEFEIARINRALRMLSSTNQALIRTTNETELLNEACRIIVEIGGYQLAWVGFAEDDKAGTLRPVSYTGFYSGDYGPEGISRADNERGQNPEDITIRTGQPYLAHNIPVDLLFYTW